MKESSFSVSNEYLSKASRALTQKTEGQYSTNGDSGQAAGYQYQEIRKSKVQGGNDGGKSSSPGGNMD